MLEGYGITECSPVIALNPDDAPRRGSVGRVLPSLHWALVDVETGKVLVGPEIITRGWVYAPEAEDLLEDAKQVVRESIAKAAGEGATDFETMRRHCRKSLARFIDERTRRRPAVIPVVMEV